MNQFFKGFLASLTPGVRSLLAVLTVAGLATFICQWTHTFDLSGWLALTAQSFWRGQLWRLVSYAILPVGLLNFFMNAIMLVMLGGRLERIQSRTELWMICILSTAGAGLAEVLLPFSNAIPLAGAGPMIFGLLAAWSFLFGHERIYLPLFGAMTVWHLALLAGAVSFLIGMFTLGWRTTAVMAAGGLSGWFYVWLRRKWLMSHDSRAVSSERISRIEL